MLCVVEILKEHRTVLWGAKIDICMDHIDRTKNTIILNCFMTWRMPCKEFSPVFHHVKGPDDVKADAPSQLSFSADHPTLSSLEKKEDIPFADSADSIDSTIKNINSIKNINPLAGDGITTGADNGKTNVIEKTNISDPSDLFIDHPPVDLPSFPIAFPQVEQAQQQDNAIQNTAHCSDTVFCDHTLKVHEKNDGSSKIALPEALVELTIKQRHHTLGLAGADRLLHAISQFPHSPGLKQRVQDFCKTCEACQ